MNVVTLSNEQSGSSSSLKLLILASTRHTVAISVYKNYNVANNPKEQINLNGAKEKALLYCLMSWKLLHSAVAIYCCQ